MVSPVRILKSSTIHTRIDYRFNHKISLIIKQNFYLFNLYELNNYTHNRLLYVFDSSCIVLSLISSIKIKNSVLNCSEKYVLVALAVAVNKTKKYNKILIIILKGVNELIVIIRSEGSAVNLVIKCGNSLLCWKWHLSGFSR